MDWDRLAGKHKEISHLSWPQRARVLDAARRRMRRRAAFWLEQLPLWTTAAALLAGPMLLSAVERPLSNRGMALSLVASLVLGAWGALRAQRQFRRALREELLTRKVRPAYCFECGYDLGGNLGPRCPECGARVGVDEARVDMKEVAQLPDARRALGLLPEIDHLTDLEYDDIVAATYQRMHGQRHVVLIRIITDSRARGKGRRRPT